MQQIRPSHQNKKTPDLERLLICNSKMVQQVDYRWNHFEASLRLLHARLEKLGITYSNNQMDYLCDEASP